MSRDDSPVVRDVSPDEGYTYMHRAFFQAFLTHSVMTAEEIKLVLAHVMTAHNPERPCFPGDITQPLLTSTLQTINAKISHYDFEIRWIKDQRTKLLVYALVNKTSDALTQLATTYSASEIAYIRRLLDYMFETNNTPTREVMAIKHLDASQLARISRRNRQSQVANEDREIEGESQTDTGISIAEADVVLTSLVREGFFEKHGKDSVYYSLAPRALMELRAYLKETYNDEDATRIRDCEGCSQIVTFGVRCDNRECGVRWHDWCANQYYRGKSTRNRGCPKCETVLSGRTYVGERADRIRRSTGQVEDEEEEEAEDE